MSEAGSSDLHQNFQVMDNFTVIRGAHNFKMGYAYAHPDHFNIAAAGPQRGSYNFTGKYSGIAYADFVLGYPLTTSGPRRPSSTPGSASTGTLLLAGRLEVTRNLTLNYGVRYDLQFLQGQRYGQVSMFIPDKRVMAVFQEQFPKQTITRLVDVFGVKLAKDVGLPSDLFKYLSQDTNNWAPRLGSPTNSLLPPCSGAARASIITS